MFVGFLILDAIIANQDRHEDNWAVLRAQLSTGRDLLAASYDHGSSLGHNLLDSKREAMLRNREELSAFACRGKAKRFEHSESRGPVTLVKLAAEAMEMVDPAVASWWRDRLKEFKLASIHEIIGALQGMSPTESKFVSELLDLNLGRVRDALGCS